jgi:cytochrome c-type biogenesis protein CcmF
VITLLITAAVIVVEVRNVAAIAGIAVSTLVAVSIAQELIRGTWARHRATGSTYPLAFLQLVASNRPRYGGYVVHLAVVMLAFGIIGSSFYSLERDVILNLGESATIGAYSVEFVSTDTTVFADRTERTALMNLVKNGSFVGSVEAWHGFYPSFSMLSTRAGIRSTPVEDLYVIFSELQPSGQTASFRLLLNPMVWWMWLAGPFVILGTVVALWPARQRATTIVTNPPREGALPPGSVL